MKREMHAKRKDGKETKNATAETKPLADYQVSNTEKNVKEIKTVWQKGKDLENREMKSHMQIMRIPKIESTTNEAEEK